MRKIGNRILGGALAAWLLALASCGTAPTAPRLNGGGGTDGGSMSSAGAGGASRDGLIKEVIGPGGVAGQVRPQPRPIDGDDLELLEPVTGASGATLNVGCITVTVPPDAFSGEAQIKVTVPDSTKLECHLEIYPASKNNFAVPVRLEFDVRAAGDPRVMVVFWFDEQARGWVPLTTTMDATTGRVWAELPHFSIYKADSEVQGRAGW